MEDKKKKDHSIERKVWIIITICIVDFWVMFKIYQINAHSIRVLDRSDSPVVVPPRPGVPFGYGVDNNDSETKQPSGPSSDAFASFTVSKRPKFAQPTDQNHEADVPKDVSARNAHGKSEKSKKKESNTKGKKKDDGPSMASDDMEVWYAIVPSII